MESGGNTVVGVGRKIETETTQLQHSDQDEILRVSLCAKLFTVFLALK